MEKGFYSLKLQTVLKTKKIFKYNGRQKYLQLPHSKNEFFQKEKLLGDPEMNTVSKQPTHSKEQKGFYSDYQPQNQSCPKYQ